MKHFFLPLILFVSMAAHSQDKDSLQEVEMIREMSEASIYAPGKVLPAFTAKDLNGKTYTHYTIRNGKKVTFLNLWFISCAPCIAEMSHLNRLYDMMKDSADFQFVALTWETEDVVKKAIKKYGIRFPVFLSSHKDAWAATFAKGGYPANIILDAVGRVQWGTSGGSLKPGPALEAYWKQEIEKVLHK